MMKPRNYMKKRILTMFGSLALMSVPNAAVAGDFGLQHVKGIHTVGARAGTGWGNTFDAGLSYGYQLHRHWAIQVRADYEKGVFRPLSDYQGFRMAPGVEAMVWNPRTWFYLHLNAHLLWGWDWWSCQIYNKIPANRADNGTLLGCDAGFSLDFYPRPEWSLSVGVSQEFRHSWLQSDKYPYFAPCFYLGFYYHIR